MLKRVGIQGYIEIPDEAELPQLGEIVTVSDIQCEVVAELVEKKRRGEMTELVFTRKTSMLEGAAILKVEPAPQPLFDQEG